MEIDGRIYDTDSLFDLDAGPWAYDFKSGYWATHSGRIARPSMLVIGNAFNRWSKEIVSTTYFYPAKWIKSYLNAKGYERLSSGELAHRVVARAWLPSSEKPFVNHKNCQKDDNHIENLEWVTSSENAKHKYDSDPDYKRRKGEALQSVAPRGLPLGHPSLSKGTETRKARGDDFGSSARGTFWIFNPDTGESLRWREGPLPSGFERRRQ